MCVDMMNCLIDCGETMEVDELLDERWRAGGSCCLVEVVALMEVDEIVEVDE